MILAEGTHPAGTDQYYKEPLWWSGVLLDGLSDDFWQAFTSEQSFQSNDSNPVSCTLPEALRGEAANAVQNGRAVMGLGFKPIRKAVLNTSATVGIMTKDSLHLVSPKP